eukprot:5071213-Heterocapsa_arctica.AAC.1
MGRKCAIGGDAGRLLPRTLRSVAGEAAVTQHLNGSPKVVLTLPFPCSAGAASCQQKLPQLGGQRK